MSFEWDHEKARRNEAKHGVSFELARRVWDDPFHLVVPDRVHDGGPRWYAIGIVSGVTLPSSYIPIRTPKTTLKSGSSVLVGPRDMKDASMSSPPLSPELREQAERLARLPEESIDTNDIPEVPEENWKYARRPALERWLANRVELDPDVLTWFKQHAERGEYQKEINRILRQHVSTTAA